MSKNLLIIGLILLVAATGVVLVVNISQKPPLSQNSAAKSQKAPSDLLPNESIVTESPGTAKIEIAPRYVEYSETLFEQNNDKKRVLYFHAKWCPICKGIDKEFATMTNKIPPDVVIFKTDYDTQNELKKKYAITYQHTFVQVDENGNEIIKWNGGGLTELIANVK